MKKGYTILRLIISAIMVILVVCSLFLLFNAIKNKNQQISTETKILQDKINEKNNINMFSAKISEIKDVQDSLNRYLIDPNKIDTFVGYLEEMGSQMGSDVSVEGVEVSPEINNMILFKLSIKGTFQSVSRMIALLENIPYQIDITQIYFNKDLSPEKEFIGTEKPVLTGSNKQINIKSNNPPATPIWQADVSFNILSLN
jgi:hypothetical protein